MGAYSNINVSMPTIFLNYQAPARHNAKYPIRGRSQRVTCAATFRWKEFGCYSV
jgi:hypothetical protein